MTQVRNAYELDARSGAFVNDTLPGIDGSVLGANTVPEPTGDVTEGRNSLTTIAGSVLWGAAVGGGLLALGMAFVSRRLWQRPSRSFLGYLTRRRPRRWGFAR